MREFFNWVVNMFSLRLFPDVVDIAVATLGIYLLLNQVRGTRAVQLIKGFVALTVVVLITGTHFLDLKVTNWALNVILQNWVLALIILFQPELRLLIEQIGRGNFLPDAFRPTPDVDVTGMINELVRAARRLSEKHIGGLVAVERAVGLNDIVSTGRRIGGAVSSELLQTIFYPGTPMHDGGVVIQGQQVVAAMCLFPLTNREDLPRPYGTRHRAAIGLSELTDAVVLVVSEESGAISLAVDGQLIGNLSVEALKERLLTLLQPADTGQGRWFWRRESTEREQARPTSAGEAPR